MRRTLLIAKREYLVAVKTKAFIIGLVLAPIMFGGGFIGLALLKAKPDLKDTRIAILDRTGSSAAAIVHEAAKKNSERKKPRYVFETIAPASANADAQRLELSSRVRAGDLAGFLEIENSSPVRVRWYANSGIDEDRRWLLDPVDSGLRRARLTRLGVDAARFDEILAATGIDQMSLLSRDERTGQIQPARKKSELEGAAVPGVVLLLMGMIVIAGAAPVLSAMAEEKSNRVFEMILASATPFEIMAGKVIANVARSLTSSVFYIGGGLLALQGMAMTGLFPFNLLPWFFIFLVADVTMLCALGLALGAASGSALEAQNLAILLLSPVLIPMFVMIVILQQPNGAMATALSLFPPFTPMLMITRQAMPGGVPAWQPWLGLVGTLAFTVAMTWAAARVFRLGILLQGKTPKPAELLRWAVRG